VVSDQSDRNWMTGIKEVGKLGVLTSGATPSDPAGLLGSEKMDQLLSDLKEVADVVVIDGPPLFVTDAMILASKVSGVLMVVRPGHTRLSLAKTAMEHIKLVGARVVGVVLNRIPLRGADYYAGNGYLQTYYSGSYGDNLGGSDRLDFSGSIVMMDLKRWKESLSPYAKKVRDSIRHRFQTVFKLSPK
jgi:Mrp family chromosome partitioning ATPase